MKIIEMTPEELIRYPARAALDARAPEGLLIIKTKLEALDAIILNVFSPYNKVLWYFDVYRKMLRQLRKYEEIYRNDGVNFVGLLCKQAKLPKKNISLYRFFYPIVSGKGDMFLPGANDPDSELIWSYAQRHFSVLIPSRHFDGMLQYFYSQIELFGDLSFKLVDEDVEVVGSHAMESFYGYEMLCKHPLRMSEEEKLNALSFLNRDNALSDIPTVLNLILSARGGINIISNVLKRQNPNPLNLEICKRRFDVCSEVYVPHVYENIEGALSNLAPEDEYLAPLFGERLAKLKEKYPVMDVTL